MISNHAKSCTASVLKRAGKNGSHYSLRCYTTDNKPGNGWDFLSNSSENNSPNNTSKDDLVFNADAGDAYAQQKPLISDASEGYPISQKSAQTSSGQKVRLSKENLNEVFRAPRQHKTSDSAFSGVQATHQERLAFAKIFDTILQRARTSSPGVDNSKLLKKSEGLLPSMQAIFEKKFDATEQGSSLAENDGGEGGVRVTNDDIRKYPMSMGPFMDMPKSTSIDLTRVFQIQTTLKRKFEPILKHMNENLLTDAELSDFFKTMVLSRFQQKKKDNKAAQGNSKVSLVNHDLDDLEALDVTLENFPVDHNTLPFLLKESMRILADDFNSPVDALTLFELTKRGSIDTYVAGCNISVYNEVIRIKWNAFQDLHFVESLINEMQVNGILGNSETAEVLGDISKAVTSIKAPKALQMPNLTTASDNNTAETGTALWSQADEERIENINKFRLQTMQTLIKHDSIKHDSLLSGLMSR
ncbi:uncharacterized protein SAPINGB_P005934 [Magnusiomyces paraingens]|uniref:Mtf2-like C-terminal domain-containing protein n=1 Tax=Magnusiomyces paraingens TaxID=2606893 RepID=A0A5E8C2C6_9ASCO|nr:uncharacterized protein SAPINGB_P005934 [Saprochaete ingens]VVT57894.1 unnamed protein product [Saprochaete ingens]